MQKFSEMRVPPPTDDKEFEKLCRDIWRKVWNDPYAECNGRSGQNQAGVDVFGRPNQGSDYSGIQCKAVVALSANEILEEIEKAKEFDPPLNHLIIATTLRRDVNHQRIARQSTVDNHALGLFSVSISSWDEILEFLDSNPDIARKYLDIDPLDSGTATALMEHVSAVGIALTGEIKRSQEQTVSIVDSLGSIPVTAEYHHELNLVRDRLRERHFADAADLLRDFRNRFWYSSDDIVRYRITHYEGLTLYRQGQHTEAAKRFLEALYLNPDNGTAQAYVALAHLLLGARSTAYSAAVKVLETFPAEDVALQVLIQSASESLTDDEVVQEIPEILRTASSVYFSLAFRSGRRNDTISAVDWCRRAIKADTEVDPDASGEAHALLGSTLIIRAFGDISGNGILRRSNAAKDAAEEAERCLTIAWEKVRGTESASMNVIWLINRGMARRFLGRYSEAIADFEESLILSPHDLEAVPRRALLAVDIKDIEFAIKFLRTEWENSSATVAQRFTYGTMLAGILSDQGEQIEASIILDVIERMELSREQLVTFHRLRFDSSLSIGDISSATASSDYLKSQDLPTARAANEGTPSNDWDDIDRLSVAVLVRKARLKQAEGDEEEYIRILVDVAEAVASDKGNISFKFGDLFNIASELQKAELWGALVPVLRRLVDPETAEPDDPVFRSLVNACMRAGDRGEAFKLAAQVVERKGPSPVLSELATQMAEQAGDLARAARFAESYVAKYPDDFSMQLRLAAICYRARNDAGIDAFLDSNSAQLDDSARSLTEIEAALQLLIYRHKYKLAIPLGYEMRRRFPTEQTALSRYMGLFFTGLNGIDVSDVVVRDVVALESVVTVRDDSEIETTYLISQSPEGGSTITDLMPTSALALKLLGKCKGDKMMLDESEYLIEEGTISYVESKYVRAFHETINTYNRLFPEDKSMMRFRVPTVPEAEDNEEAPSRTLEEIIPLGIQRMLREQRERGEATERMFRERIYPVGYLARIAGRSILDILELLRTNSQFEIRATSSTQSLEVAVTNLSKHPNLVADVVGLYSLYSLPCRDKLMSAIGCIGVAQATLDALIILLRSQNVDTSNRRLTLGYTGASFVAIPMSEDEIQREVDFLTNFVAWVESHCSIMPCEAVFDLDESDDVMDDLLRMLGFGYRETLRIAGQDGYALYSDDEIIRRWADFRFPSVGVWTQALLWRAREDSGISENEYQESIVHLIRNNYRETYFDMRAIIEAARLADWLPKSPYKDVVMFFASSLTPGPQAFTTVGQIVALLSRENPPSYKFDLLVSSLLFEVIKGRPAWRIVMLETITQTIHQVLVLEPVGKANVINCIRAWDTASRST